MFPTPLPTSFIAPPVDFITFEVASAMLPTIFSSRSPAPSKTSWIAPLKALKLELFGELSYVQLSFFV